MALMMFLQGENKLSSNAKKDSKCQRGDGEGVVTSSVPCCGGSSETRSSELLFILVFF